MGVIWYTGFLHSFLHSLNIEVIQVQKIQYVKRKANKLFFTKRWPKSLANVIGTVGFSAPLGGIEQTQAEVIAKVSKALKEYDVKVKLATNSNPNDYQDNEIDILVQANLRRLKQVHGLPQFVAPDQHVIDHNSNSFNKLTAEDIEFNPADPQPTRTTKSQEFISNRVGLANSLVSLDGVLIKQELGQKLTIKDKVAGATWVALQEKAKKKPKMMLYDQWAKYTAFQGLTTSTTNWDKFCGPIIQNRSLNLSLQGHQDFSRELNQGLNLYRNSRVGVVKIATIKRELNSIRACLKFITLEYQFGWLLEKTRLQKPKAGEVKERLPLSMEHQQKLVAYCLSKEHRDKPQATMALLYLQGGVMPTEVSRMRPEVQIANLTNVAPHLSILGETKTGARRRPVPVVLGLDVVRDNIEKTIAWANIPRATRIGQMKRFLDLATDTKGLYVSHGLRHTFSQNCRLSNCRDDDKCTLGGWTSYGGASSMSRRYGASGMFDQSNIERLYKVSLDIHRNLL